VILIHAVIRRLRSRANAVALLCFATAFFAGTPPAASHDMASMSGHMYMTSIRPLKDGDTQKANALVTDAKAAM